MLEEVEDFNESGHVGNAIRKAHGIVLNEHQLARHWTRLLEKLIEDDEQAALRLFSDVLHHENKKPVELSKSDLHNLVPLIVSVFVSVVASLVYWTPAIEAAEQGLPWVFGYFSPSLKYIDIAIDTPLNPLSSSVVNIFINVYYGNKLLMNLWQQFIESHVKPLVRYFRNIPHSDNYKALRILHDKDDSARGRLKRYAKNFGLSLLYGVPAVISAFPMYLLDLRKSGNPAFVSTMVLFSYTILAVNGVNIFVNKVTPLIAPVFRKPYHYFKPEAGRRFRTQRDIETLKSAHLSVLISALVTLLDLMQKEEYETLKPFYALLIKAKTNPLYGRELYLRVLRLAQMHDTSKITKVFRYICQGGAVIGNGFSLIGYYGSTAAGTQMFFKDTFGITMQPAANHFVTALLFAPMAFLTSDVCADVVGEIYDCGVHFGSNVRRNRADRRASEAAGLTYMSSWNPLVRLPLAAKQHPGAVLSLLYVLTIFTYWSIATSLQLNSETLDATWAIAVAAPTIIFGVLFNSFAFKPIIYDSQKLMVRLKGSPENKTELRIEDFVKDLIATWQSFDSQQVLRILLDFTADPAEENGSDYSNRILNDLFFAHQTPADIFGNDHRFAREDDFREVIATLATEANVWPAQARQHTHFRFFGQQEEESRLLPNRSSVNQEPAIFDPL